MEPNTTFPSASGTHPSILEQGLPSVLAAETQHLSPAPFLPQPSPDFMSEWFSSSMSPAMEHAASQPVFSPPFSALGEVHMTGGEGEDFFAQQETPETTDIPSVLGDQQPSLVVSGHSGGVPAFTSEGTAIFPGQPALPEPNVASTWQSEMPLLEHEQPSGSGLPASGVSATAFRIEGAAFAGFADQSALPELTTASAWQTLPSTGGGVGSTIPWSEYDLAPLPESLCVPSMEEPNLYNMSSTIDGSLSMGDESSSMSSFQQDLTTGAPVLPMTTPLFQTVGSFSSSPQDITMSMGAMKEPALPMTPSLSPGVGNFISSQQDLTIEDMGAHLLPMTPSLPHGVGSSMSSIGTMGAPSQDPSNLMQQTSDSRSSPQPTSNLYHMSSTVDGSSSMGDGSSSMSFQQDLTMRAPVLPITPPLFQDAASFISSQQDMTMTMGAMGAPLLPMTPSLSHGVGSFMSSPQDLTMEAVGAQGLPMTPSLPHDVGSFISSPQNMTMTMGAMGAQALPMTPSLSQGVGSFMSSTQDMAMTMGEPSVPMTPSLPLGIIRSCTSSSLQDVTTAGAMGAPVLPMTTSPLSQGPSNFVQPTSDAEHTAAPASFQAPLLQVKEEPVDNTSATQMEPVYISLDDEEDEQIDQDAIATPLPQHSMPDSSTGNVLSLSSKLKLLEQLYNIKSMSTGASKSNVMPSTSTRASAGVTLSSSTSTRAASASSTLSSLTRAGVKSNMQVAHINVNGVLFTHAEMEILRKDKNMQELVATDIKKVKRTIANRICSARRHTFKEMHTLELERQAEALHNKWKEVSIQLQLRQVQYAELKENNRKMSMMIQEMKRQDMLKDALTEALQAQIEALNLMNQHTALQTTPPE